MKLLELNHLSVELKKEPFRYLVTTWTGHATKENFLSGIDSILEFVIKYQARKILNDVRKQQVVGTDAQNEAAEKIKAFVKQHGIFKQAMLVSQDIFIQFGTKNFDNKVKQEVRDEINHFFSSEEDAVKWLEEQKV